MAEINYPYCNGRNVLKMSYAYRGVNKKKNKNIDYNKYLKEGTIFMPKVRFEKYDFNDEKIKYAKLDNRYCVDFLDVMNYSETREKIQPLMSYGFVC